MPDCSLCLEQYLIDFAPLSECFKPLQLCLTTLIAFGPCQSVLFAFQEFSHILMGLLISPPALCILSPIPWEDSADSKKVLQKCKESGQDPHLASFVFVAPHCLMTYHRLPSFWMAGCIRQTFQQSLSFPPLLMETLMSSSNSDRISRRHSMLNSWAATSTTIHRRPCMHP